MKRTLAGRFGAGLKAFRMAWSGTGGGGAYGGLRWPGLSLGTLPGARFDYESAAGDLLLNAPVAICLGWIADNVVEPELRVVRGWNDGTPEPIDGHALTSLLRHPNPFYDGDALWAATAVSYSAHGNAYWLKVRNGAGLLKELWWVPHWQVEPRWPSDGSEFISHYVYRVNGTETRIRREDVVHFRFGIDPGNPRLGQSRLRAVLREIVTDNEASSFMAALLRNMGVPGVLITPVGDQVEIADEDAAEMKRQFKARYAGENAGEPLVPTVPVKVEQLSLSPEELVLDRVRNAPEARICGALRIPTLVVGLNVGDMTKTFANYGQARKAAYEDCLMPMARRFASTLNDQVLYEVGDPRSERCEWNFTRVAALREDLTDVFRRNNLGVGGGWMTVNEARARAGLEPDPKGDLYLRALQAPSADSTPAVIDIQTSV